MTDASNPGSTTPATAADPLTPSEGAQVARVPTWDSGGREGYAQPRAHHPTARPRLPAGHERPHPTPPHWDPLRSTVPTTPPLGHAYQLVTEFAPQLSDNGEQLHTDGRERFLVHHKALGMCVCVWGWGWVCVSRRVVSCRVGVCVSGQTQELSDGIGNE